MCYPWLHPYNANKLQPRSSPCVSAGYSTEHYAYWCLDQQTNRIFISHHVIFVEHSFSFPERLVQLDSLSQWALLDSPPCYSIHVVSTPTPSSAPASAPTAPVSNSLATTPQVSIFLSSPALPTPPPTPTPPSPPSHYIVTRSKNNIFKPNKKFCLTTTDAGQK